MAAGKENGSWIMEEETVLLKRNLDEAIRGTHPPRPLVVPIYNSSTYLFENAEEGKELSMNHSENGYLYSRWGNPTHDVACDLLAKLEGAAGSLLFPSGCAAITTCLFSFLKAGDHMVISQPVYGGANSMIRNIVSKLGVEVTWIEGRKAEDFKNALKENTKVLYGEALVNPTMNVLDVEEFGALGKSLPGVVTVVDSTFTSPYLLQPIKHGVDVVLHSCSKYIGGHSDVIAGAVSYAREELCFPLKEHQILLGTNISPFDAFLIQRSLKTLAVRMDRHSSNALSVAEFLEAHPKVTRVNFPGLKSHPDYEVAERLMGRKGFSGMLSVELEGGLQSGIKLVESVKVFQHAVSLGGVESLVCHPASTTHCDAYVSPEDKRIAGITDGLIRISVGIENVRDLIKDLEQALDCN